MVISVTYGKSLLCANALFLSTAVNLNSDQLRPVFSWFVNKLIVVAGNMRFAPEFTIERVREGAEKSAIINFLQAADLGIVDIKIETHKAQQVDFKAEPGKVTIHASKETEISSITFFHRGRNGEVVGMDSSVESEGTRRLFTYAGPILDVLRQGHILVVDELDNSLHPKMMRFLINLMHNSELNKNQAQLIFSTHDTSLLDNHLFGVIKSGLSKKIKIKHQNYIHLLISVLVKMKH